ncbi:MAG: hypothetical protein QX189_04830 [Methylococcales bacterium]
MEFMKKLFILCMLPVSLAVNAEIKGDYHRIIDSITKNFGYPGMETTWFKNIKEISGNDDGTEIVVNTDTTDREKISNICAAVAFIVSEKDVIKIMSNGKLALSTYSKETYKRCLN